MERPHPPSNALLPGQSAPISVRRFPTAVLHVDADAFFASCEQAMHPALKGKPVVTGQERGIVAAASYEAKARGVSRAMRLHEAKAMCPDLVVLPSDYESYSLFSLRMFEILRRFSPTVEEYSIDEAFADVYGMRRTLHCSYDEIARRVQSTILRELDLSVSVGISLTKVLAKIASKWHKPAGLTVFGGRYLHRYLGEVPAGKVWGIGPNTAALLAHHGVYTALDLAQCSETFVKKHLSKPFQEVWHELNGRQKLEVTAQPRADYQSISKTKTFTPASCDREFVFAQLTRNLENACIKARRHHMVAHHLVVYLRTQDFQDSALELSLSRASAYPVEMMPLLRTGFEKLFMPLTAYRCTGVILGGLIPEASQQLGLFDDSVGIERLAKLHCAVDAVSKRFGKHTLLLGSSLPTKQQAQHESERGDVPWRHHHLFHGETARQRLGLLVLDIEV